MTAVAAGSLSVFIASMYTCKMSFVRRPTQVKARYPNDRVATCGRLDRIGSQQAGASPKLRFRPFGRQEDAIARVITGAVYLFRTTNSEHRLPTHQRATGL